MLIYLPKSRSQERERGKEGAGRTGAIRRYSLHPNWNLLSFEQLRADSISNPNSNSSSNSRLRFTLMLRLQ